MNRDEVATELLLRENIRRIINTVKQSKIDEKRERALTENALRKVIRKLLNEKAAVPDEVPNRSTGINVLEELLKKIVPVLEADFKSLTSDEEQRGSFRAHVLNAVKNILTVADTNDDVSVMSEPEGDLEEDIDIKVSDENAKDDRFIDIEPEKETDPKDEFSKGLEGSNLDQTGRNVAFNSFKKIEQNILDSYELLDNEKDAKIFYDYLLTNVKLYFDKFEDELSGTVPDITTPEYEEAQKDEEPAEDTEL
jgi:hypothetical protein